MSDYWTHLTETKVAQFNINTTIILRHIFWEFFCHDHILVFL